MPAGGEIVTIHNNVLQCIFKNCFHYTSTCTGFTSIISVFAGCNQYQGVNKPVYMYPQFLGHVLFFNTKV